MLAVEGRLVLSSGETVAGVRVVRTWPVAWTDRRGEVEAVTLAVGDLVGVEFEVRPDAQ